MPRQQSQEAYKRKRRKLIPARTLKRTYKKLQRKRMREGMANRIIR